jgi:uncharacterized membrane protein YczE
MARLRPAVHLMRRVVQLLAGLAVMGIAITAMKRSRLGLSPWDVFHDGVARHTGLDLGLVGIAVGVPILFLWFPLHERPGVGTVTNVFVVGWVVHGLLPRTSPATAPAARAGLLAMGIGLFALGQGLYLSAGLGPGPRDGLMTGLHTRLGWSIRSARTIIETAALIGGVALGGTAGIGTVAFAFAIGPMVQVMLRWFGFGGAGMPELGGEPVDAIGLAGE